MRFDIDTPSGYNNRNPLRKWVRNVLVFSPVGATNFDSFPCRVWNELKKGMSFWYKHIPKLEIGTKEIKGNDWLHLLYE